MKALASWRSDCRHTVAACALASDAVGGAMVAARSGGGRRPELGFRDTSSHEHVS
eukprot:SAG31_NODE_327_length_17650_cov_18.626574_4_plen_55_part_00